MFQYVHSISATVDETADLRGTNGTAKICCRGLILALFYSTIVIKNDFG